MLEDTKGVIHKFINRRGGKYNGSKDEKTNNGRQNPPHTQNTDCAKRFPPKKQMKTRMASVAIER
jgi:hypothetical protein